MVNVLNTLLGPTLGAPKPSKPKKKSRKKAKAKLTSRLTKPSLYPFEEYRGKAKHKATIIVEQRVFVPKHLISRRQILRRYSRILYNEKGCKGCDIRPDRSINNDTCQTCSNFEGAYLTHRDPFEGQYLVSLGAETSKYRQSVKEPEEPENAHKTKVSNYFGVIADEVEAGQYEHKEVPNVVDLYTPREDKHYWSLPQGDLKEIVSFVESRVKREPDLLRVKVKKNGKTVYRKAKLRVVDLRDSLPFENPIKFNGSLRDGTKVDGFNTVDQRGAVEAWWKNGKSGILCAPPRSGKTVMSTFAYCKLGVRTVIITHSRDLLNQFHQTATGVSSPNYKSKAPRKRDANGKLVPLKKAVEEKEGESIRKAMTNLKQLQEESEDQRPLIYMPKSIVDLRNYVGKYGKVPEVLLISYQSFIRDYERVANLINRFYSFMICDEVHRSGADSYLNFLECVSVKYRMSLSATPIRKDGKDVVFKLYSGGVAVTVQTDILLPQIHYSQIRTVPASAPSNYQQIQKYFASGIRRHREIAKRLLHEMVKDGHNVAILPVDRRENIENLIVAINQEAKSRSEKFGEKWPSVLARPYHSQVDRDRTLKWIDKTREKPLVVCKHKPNSPQDPKILVATRSMVTEGIDLGRPSLMYCTVPMSADMKNGCPNFEQIAYRVCTPFNGKPSPVVRVMIDPTIGMSSGCAISLLMHEIVKKSTLAKARDQAKYVLTPETYDNAKKMATAASRYGARRAKPRGKKSTSHPTLTGQTVTPKRGRWW